MKEFFIIPVENIKELKHTLEHVSHSEHEDVFKVSLPCTPAVGTTIELACNTWVYVQDVEVSIVGGCTLYVSRGRKSKVSHYWIFFFGYLAGVLATYLDRFLK